MKPAKKIAIFGTGGNCLDILDTLMDINAAQSERVYECIGFFDDDPARQGRTFLGVPVLGPLVRAADFNECRFVFGIGSTKNHWRRRDIFTHLGLPDERFETIIHPTASVSRTAGLGYGTVIFQNVTVTTNVQIGNHVCVLPNSVISHDAVIGDFTLVAGGVCLSGNARVGQGCYLGSNSVVKEGLTIGDESLLGMGSVLTRDLAANSIAMGNPARIIRQTRAQVTP